MTEHTNENELRQPNPTESGEKVVIPVVEEQLSISTRQVTTGQVDVEKRVRTETVDVPLSTVHTHYREERIPANRAVDTMPQPRYEGENLIIPVVREEAVVVKRLILVEEIHLIRTTEVDEHTKTVELRSEEATITHREPQ